MGDIMHMIRVSYVVLEVLSATQLEAGKDDKGQITGSYGKLTDTLMYVSSNAGAHPWRSFKSQSRNRGIQAKKCRPPGGVRGLTPSPLKEGPNFDRDNYKSIRPYFLFQMVKITKLLVCG
jgi:hypothetical protein